MNIEQYPKRGYFIMLKTAITQLGSYELNEAGDIKLAHLRVYYRNSAAYNHQIRLVLSTNIGGFAVAASDWETLSNETTGQTTEFWMGDLTFTFEPYALKTSDQYYARLEITNYTRLDNERYMGVWVDWLEPVGSDNTAGARIALGVLR